MFQIAALHQLLHPEEKVLLIDFGALETVFPRLPRKFTLLRYPQILSRFGPQIDAVVKLLAKIRLFGQVTAEKNASHLVRKSGLLPIVMFSAGYCQNEQICDMSFMKELFADNCETNRAETMCHTEQKRAKKFFVHVRRADYRHWPTEENSAVLPISWFIEQMGNLRSTEDVEFLVFSDDFDEEAVSAFQEPGLNARIMDVSAKEAFFHMAGCDGGILSASTFSWWAAYFASQVGKGPFIAPQFWGGWPTKTWHPHENIKSNFLTYRAVDLD